MANFDVSCRNCACFEIDRKRLQAQCVKTSKPDESGWQFWPPATTFKNIHTMYSFLFELKEEDHVRGCFEKRSRWGFSGLKIDV